ncbi:methyl-accepting chemotaxis protein [Aciduricibacillus chroicocephali]|uniref:Methyl-accepting chemotaxis protein n=1 Tax=Aciduricibacillus chroicocephali TaxID=3054939 RepID=A0ABY9KTE5_9BACI|nr:methyl-accepting chemotaxis protein [Bacillaceae bacterium 44XB]
MLKRFNSSIKAKITALLLAISLGPLIVATIIISSQSNAAIHKEVEGMQTNKARDNAQYINSWLEQKITAMENVIGAHPEFAKGNKKDIMPVLKTIAEADNDVKWYSFLNEKGTALSTLGKTAEVSDQEHFKTVSQNKETFISDVFPDVNSGNNILIIDVPIIDQNGSFAGAVQAILDPAQILTLVDSIKIGESGYGYLVSSEGNVLVHRNESKVGKPVASGAAFTEYKRDILSKPNGFMTNDNDTIAFQQVALPGWHLVTVAPKNEVFANVDRMRFVSILIIAGFVVLVAVVSYVLARFVIRQLSGIIGIMQKVANGDLRERLDTSGTDEISQVKKNINQMLDAFSSLVSKITSTTRHVAASSGELAQISHDSSQASTAISQSVDSVADSSEAQYQASEQAAAATDEMALGIMNIAESAIQVSSSAQLVSGQVEQGNSDVKQAIGQITVASGTVKESAAIVQSLKEKSQEVHQIITLISEIADQTNLLALNASIEAARAGEHGQGFTVVANEVKKLAVQTGDATVDIRNIIDEIIQSTGTASESMNDGLEEVQNSMGQIEKLGGIFDSIRNAFNDVNSQIESVSSRAEQISAGTEEVSAATQDVTTVFKTVLDELNEVAASAKHQSEMDASIAAASETLTRMANELEELTQAFKITE